MLGKVFNFLFILIFVGVTLAVGLTVFDNLSESFEENPYSEASNVTDLIGSIGESQETIFSLMGLMAALGFSVVALVFVFSFIRGSDSGGFGSDGEDDDEDEEVQEIFNERKSIYEKIFVPKIPKVLPQNKLTEDEIIRSEFD